MQRAEWYRRYKDDLWKELPEVNDRSIIEGITESVEKLPGTKPAVKTVWKYLEIDRKIGKEAKRISLPRSSEKASLLKISHKTWRPGAG